MERTVWSDERIDDTVARIEARFERLERRMDRLEVRMDDLYRLMFNATAAQLVASFGIIATLIIRT